MIMEDIKMKHHKFVERFIDLLFGLVFFFLVVFFITRVVIDLMFTYNYAFRVEYIKADSVDNIFLQSRFQAYLVGVRANQVGRIKINEVVVSKTCKLITEKKLVVYGWDIESYCNFYYDYKKGVK